MKTHSSTETKLPALERLLLQLDQPPSSILFRVAIGYTLPFLYRWERSDETGWVFILWFIGTLISLRVLPAVFRKLFPFSHEVNMAWMERRTLTKLYDSYQWKKLVWFGVGLLAYVSSSLTWETPIVAVALFCLLGGAAGSLFWKKRAEEGISLSGMSDVWIGSGRRL
jgi:hypothetical protein